MLEDFVAYKKSNELWDLCWNDTEILMKDIRGKELTRQLIRSAGSISANIEEGYGRGNNKEYPHFLKIARGSAQESKGWYKKSKYLLNEDLISERHKLISEIIAIINSTIKTLENKRKK